MLFYTTGILGMKNLKNISTSIVQDDSSLLNSGNSKMSFIPTDSVISMNYDYNAKCFIGVAFHLEDATKVIHFNIPRAEFQPTKRFLVAPAKYIQVVDRNNEACSNQEIDYCTLCGREKHTSECICEIEADHDNWRV